MIKALQFSEDTLELLKLMHDYKVSYVLAGGEAVIYYGHARLTGDVDLFYNNTATNNEKLFKALKKFWDGTIPGIESANDLGIAGTIFQFGFPPNRIDLMNEISGVSFEEATKGSIKEQLIVDEESIEISIISKQALIKNKKATGRNKDFDDLDFLT